MAATPSSTSIAAPATAPLYFAVSPKKLLIMSLCTLSTYEFFWFYTNWKLIKEREKSSISPFWRTFFGYFYCHALFSNIRATARDKNVEVNLPAGPLATSWIVLSFLWLLPDPFAWVSFLSIVVLLPVQVAANAINAQLAPDHDRNARFTAGNIVAVVIGGLSLLIAVCGSLLPSP
jgi:hypothetical protein